MRFQLQQRIAAPVDAVAAAFVDPGFYESLETLPNLGRPELLSHEVKGSIVRLGDIATVFDSVENERVALRFFANVYGMCVMLPASHLVPGAVQAYSAPTPGIPTQTSSSGQAAGRCSTSARTT